MNKKELQNRAGIILTEEDGLGDTDETLLRDRLRKFGVILEEEEKDTENSDDSEDNDEQDDDHYGYEVNRDGEEMDRDSGVSTDNCKTELASIHDELLSCWSDMRKCLMKCAQDGQDTPDAMRTAIDKLGRTLESLEKLVGDL